MLPSKRENDFPPELLTYIRERYHYCPDTGHIWITTKTQCKRTYDRIDKYGYLVSRIKHNKKVYTILTHRLAWFLHYGRFPDQVIDHINNTPTDNRLQNLRDVSVYLNSKRATVVNCPHCGNNIHDDLGKEKAQVTT